MERPWYKKGQFYIGPLNFEEELLNSYDCPADKKVKIVDSTIRKLESTPGARLSVADKVEIALRSEDLGAAEMYIKNVHFVPEYFESTKAIAERKTSLVLNVQTYLNDRWKEGIKKSIEAKADVAEVEARASDIELLRFGLDKKGMIERLGESLDFGNDLGAEMAAGFNDSTRADFPFLLELVNTALVHGASKLTFYDTWGALTPDAVHLFVKSIRKNMIRPVPIVMHLHNMFGLGTAAALAAVTAGATHVDVAANGLPSNCSLASLEETVLALEMFLGLDTGIDLTKLYDYCKFVERKSGIKDSAYKPLVGDHIFLFEADNDVAEHFRSGKVENLKPFAPEIIGRKSKVVWDVNTLQGDSVRAKLESMGLDYTEDQVSIILSEIERQLDSIKEYPVWLTEIEVEKICKEVIG